MKVVASKASYYFDAIFWIAENDAPGDDDKIEIIAGYLTVILVADVFDVPAVEVAAAVWKIRHPGARS